MKAWIGNNNIILAVKLNIIDITLMRAAMQFNVVYSIRAIFRTPMTETIALELQ